MSTSRLEAFSDGVLAIIITIMVLELKIPHGDVSLNALMGLWPQVASYVLSFVYLGIYWNNHHHMMHVTDFVDGTILWANLHLLFWLSLIPFTTSWMGENHFETWPTVVYGLNLLLCAIAYTILERRIIASQGYEGKLARAVGRDLKGKISPVIYVLGVLCAWFVAPWAGLALFALVAAIWIVPDRRIERVSTQAP